MIPKVTNLWSFNTPAHFWCCQSNPPDSLWQEAIWRAASILGLPTKPDSLDDLLALTLGEAQFGFSHWRLSPARRLYYRVKPFVPRLIRYALRRMVTSSDKSKFRLGWPIEDRYARFQWEVMRQILCHTEARCLSYRRFWPGGHPFAFVITHDIETAQGQANVSMVADLDEKFGFRSAFNFVPERYSLDTGLIAELQERRFEVGIHGLKHDGRLFSSYDEFSRRAEAINHYLKQFNAVGFRSPYTLRHPEWMQALEIKYDLSFFDTDPHEPIPGGVMSIWPYQLGRFVELPYTLVQDCTLVKILGETTPRLWLEKVDFIQQYHGLALVNTHPDYLKDRTARRIYCEFLEAIQRRGGYWHALPREVVKWWRTRTQASSSRFSRETSDRCWGTVRLANDGIYGVMLD